MQLDISAKFEQSLVKQPRVYIVYNHSHGRERPHFDQHNIENVSDSKYYATI